jgi:lipid-A-disaccharide synthase-like uncharacterized protein
MTTEQIWISIGLLGQFLFSCRFILQWIASEKLKKSVIPLAFWYFSIAGSLTLLAYSIYRTDPVFILGQSLGLIIYVRNLILIFRDNSTQAGNITP